jgi:hypothetical protein
VLALSLFISLVATVPVFAQSDLGFATITLIAPGAPQGAWSSVQWQDRAGTWHNVEGWQAALDRSSSSSQGFKQWGVFPKDYGRGPFRWVVSTSQGGSVWSTSPSFFLPDGDGTDLRLTLTPQGGAGGPTDTTTSATGTASTSTAAKNFATITVNVPGAPQGAWVGVQWRDTLGRWHDVEGWQAPLVSSQAADQQTKTWGVNAKDYGTGPFRWVISSEHGGRVLGTSPQFFLPSGNGANLTMTVLPKITVIPAELLTGQMGAPTTLPAQASTLGLSCAGPCDFSVISLSLANVPASSLVGVQWQDPFGAWHDVPSWQGNLDTADNGVSAYKQWTIASDLQGRGPFRWVIYNQYGDAVLGVTPGFMLPDRSGVNLIMSVPADSVSNIAG